MKTKSALPRDLDLAGIDAALRRAAKKARELAEKTRTPFYVFEDGKIIDVLKSTKKMP